MSSKINFLVSTIIMIIGLVMWSLFYFEGLDIICPIMVNVCQLIWIGVISVVGVD